MTKYLKYSDVINAIGSTRAITLANMLILPSVNVRDNVHGKWVEYPENLKFKKAYSDEQIVCSECGEVFSVIDNDTERFNFCPNCGADMRDENADNN